MNLLNRLGNGNRLGRFKTGVAYTRRSLRFQRQHPAFVGLAFVQVILAIAGLLGLIVLGLYEQQTSGILDPVFLVSLVGVYFVISIYTTLMNALITGYVFAIEMGSPTPITTALGQVRRQFWTLLSYGLLAASVLSVIRIVVGWLRGKAIVGDMVATVFEMTALGAWYAATVYAVPVLLLEERLSLRGAISKSASILQDSKWTYMGMATAWPVVIGFIVLGIALLFLIGGPRGVLSAVIAIVSGVVVYRAFNAIFRAYLYGEVAGPFNIDPE